MYTHRSRAKKREYAENLERSVHLAKEENRVLMQQYMNMQAEMQQKKKYQLQLMKRISDAEQALRKWHASSMEQQQGWMSEEELNLLRQLQHIFGNK
jgi:hypothetical protein